MGVKGLWTLLEPVGKPVTLESLEGKILAVDVSIWLHQTVHGMRDAHGDPVANAHLVGLFNRVCKLLFYKIRPVFVFDGGVPELKRQTLAIRRQQRADATARSEETTKTLLTGLLKQHAIDSALTGLAAGPLGSAVRRGTTDKVDMYQLPPMPEAESESFFDDEVERTLEVRATFLDMLTEEFQDPEEIDPESADFQALPAELQYELLKELKEHRKQRRWNTALDMPEDTEDFSNFQIKRMMNRCKLTQRLDGVRKEINAHASGDVVKTLTGRDPGEDVETQRLVSDESASYILIRGLRKHSENAQKMKVLSDIKEEEFKEEKVKESSDTVKTKHPMEDDVKGIVEWKSKTENDKGFTGTELEDTCKNSLVKHSKTIDKRKPIDAVLRKTHEYLSRDKSNIFNVSKTDAGPVCAESTRSPSPAAVTGSKSQPTVPCVEVVTVDSDSDTSDCIFIDSHKEPADRIGTKDTVAVTDIEVTDVPDDVTDDVVEVTAEGGFIHDDSSSEDDLMEVSESSESTSRNCSSAIRTTVELNRKNDLTSSDKSKNGDGSTQLRPVGVDVICSLSGSAENNTTAVRDSDEPTTPEINLVTDVYNDMCTQKKTCQADNGECLKTLQSVSPGDHLRTTITESICLPSSKTITTTSRSTQELDIVELINHGKGKGDHPSPIQISMDSDNSPSDEDDFEVVPVVDDIGLEVSYSPLAKRHSTENIAEVLESEDVQTRRGSPIVIDEEREPSTLVGRPIATKVPERPTKERQEELEAMQSQLEEESQMLEVERARLDRQAASITDTMTAEAQELLRLFGVPYIVSPMEAEAQCAYLDLTNQTAGTVTDDSDIWLFGGRHVYKNMFNHGKYVEHYSEASIHSQLLLDRFKLINIAFLCGSDYTPGIEHVGPVTAMEVLAEFPGDGLQQLRHLKTWWNQNQHRSVALPTDTKLKKRLRQLKLPSGFPSVRVSEAYLKPEVDCSEDRFTWGKPNLDLLREYATQKLGWPQSKTDEFILPVMKKLNEGSLQKHITSFFSVDFGEPRKLKSKRVKNVLNKLQKSQIPAGDVPLQTLEEGESIEIRQHTTKSMQRTNTNSRGFKGASPSKFASPSTSKAAATKRPRVVATPQEITSVAKRARRGRGGRGRSRGQPQRATATVVGRQTVDEVNLSESSSDNE